MKVNTDAILLAAWSSLPNPSTKGGVRVLDVGSGTGVIALIIAQRVATTTKNFSVEGIDIDYHSFSESALNFSNSPWSKSMQAHHLSLQSMANEEGSGSYNLIISNPPYFTRSLKGGSKAKREARHNDTLPLESLLTISNTLLEPGGILTLILPTVEAERVLNLLNTTSLKYCKESGTGLSLVRECRVKSRESKFFFRSLLEIKKGEPHIVEHSTLSIGGRTGGFTKEYIDLVGNFYLHPLLEG